MEKQKFKIAVVSGYYTNGIGNSSLNNETRLMFDTMFKSVKKYFLTDHDVDCIFISNDNIQIDNVINYKINYEIPNGNYWHITIMPLISLDILDKEYDYVFLIESDIILVNPVVDSDLLDSDFYMLDHFWKWHSIQIGVPKITGFVDMNFDNKDKLLWTMGSFKGGKYETMMELCKKSKEYHEKYYGNDFDNGFYAQYPEEVFMLKFVFENNIEHKRITCNIEPPNGETAFFTNLEFLKFENENDYFNIKNFKLIHNIKSDFSLFKKMIPFYI